MSSSRVMHGISIPTTSESRTIVWGTISSCAISTRCLESSRHNQARMSLEPLSICEIHHLIILGREAFE